MTASVRAYPAPPRPSGAASLVSVVVPVFNRESLLRRALDSVLAQTYEHFECVVTDNASTDGSVEIAAEYARRDGRIRILRNPENLGPVRNWLRGVEEARGEFVKLLYSDDWMEPDCLACAVDSFAADPGLGFVYFEVAKTETSGSSRRAESQGESGFSYIWRSVVTHGDVPASPSAAMFRREDVLLGLGSVIESDRFDFFATGVGYDQAIYFHAADSYPRIRRFTEPRVHFGTGDDSISVVMNRRCPGELMRGYLEAQLRFIARSRRGPATKLFLQAAARWHIFGVHLRRVLHSARARQHMGRGGVQ